MSSLYDNQFTTANSSEQLRQMQYLSCRHQSSPLPTSKQQTATATTIRNNNHNYHYNKQYYPTNACKTTLSPQPTTTTTTSANLKSQSRPLTIEEYERNYRLVATDLDLIERVFHGGLSSNQLRSALWPYLFNLVKQRGRFVRRTTTTPATASATSISIKNNNKSATAYCDSNNKIRTTTTANYVYIEHEDNLKQWRNLEHLYRTYENQWKSIQPDQELRFSSFRERKSLIERDVVRSDRTHPFYSSQNENYSENLTNLTKVLMSYMMYDFDIGYLQGMSDLAAPILYVFQGDVVKTFWVFVEVMKLFRRNFEFSQKTIHFQLNCLFRLIKLTDIKLATHLREMDCSNCFFVFRHIVCQFKRELMRASSNDDGSQSSTPGESSACSSNADYEDDDDDEEEEDDDSSTGSTSGTTTSTIVKKERSAASKSYSKRDDYANVLKLWDTIWFVQRRHELRAKSKCVHTYKIASKTTRRKSGIDGCGNGGKEFAASSSLSCCCKHRNQNTTTNCFANNHCKNNNNNNSNINNNNNNNRQHQTSAYHHRHHHKSSSNNLPLQSSRLTNGVSSSTQLSKSSSSSSNSTTTTATTTTTYLNNNSNQNGLNCLATTPRKNSNSSLTSTTTTDSSISSTTTNSSSCHSNSSCSPATAVAATATSYNNYTNGNNPACCSLCLRSPPPPQSIADERNQVKATPKVKQEQVVYTKETFYSSFDPNQADIPRFELTETEKFVISLCLSLIRRERNYILNNRLDASEIHQHFIRPRLASDLSQFLGQAYEIYHYLNHECDLQSLVRGASEFAAPSDYSPIAPSKITATTTKCTSNGRDRRGLRQLSTTATGSGGINTDCDQAAASSSSAATDTYDLLKDYFIISPTAYDVSLNSLNQLDSLSPVSLSGGSYHQNQMALRRKASSGALTATALGSSSLHISSRQSSWDNNFVHSSTPPSCNSSSSIMTAAVLQTTTATMIPTLNRNFE